MDSQIRISLNEKANKDITDIRVDGVIDTVTASELEQVFNSLINRQRFKIIVDLAGVDYVSSAGWGIFISKIKEARNNDGDIKLVNLTEDVYEIYELLGFENVLKIFDSLDEARVDFGAGSNAYIGKKKVKKKVK